MNKAVLKKNFMPICMTFFSLIIYIIGILIVQNKMSWTLGVLFGLLFSLLKLKLMEVTFEKAVLMPQERAKKYTTMHYMLRYVLTAIVLIVAALEPSIHLLGVFFGLVSMKVAAYMYPILIDDKSKIN